MISVVIPLYNKAHTIVDTLKSVLNQSYQEFEVIIVNDGSSDNGVEVIQNFTKDDRVVIINQENQGVSVARNVGVANANFDHVAFLDGDDYWLEGYLEAMVKAINAFSEAAMYCSAGFIKHASGNETKRLDDKLENKITKIDFFQNPGVYLHTSAAVVKKSIFNLTDGFPVGMKRNQDFALFFSVALKGDVVYSGIPLSVYNGGVPGQATQTSFEKVMVHVVNRFNYVHKYWLESDRSKRNYLVYTLYELRHLILGFIRQNKFANIKYFLSNLNKDIVKQFWFYEVFMYPKSIMKPISIAFILFSKVLWRQKGFPRVK